MEAETMDEVLKMEEILHIVLSYTSVFDLKRAACVCRQWKDMIQKNFNPGLVVVTVSGTNQLALVSTVISSSLQHGYKGGATTTATSAEIVQRFSPGPPRRKRKREGLRQRQRLVGNSYCWPTCSTLSPNGDLYVSQYKVMGVLEFKRSLEGFKYQRTLVSSPSFEYPEGLVVAHNSLYIVSVSNGNVSRVSLDRGDIIEQADCCLEDSAHVWVLWGMCISPDQRSLFIAGQLNDERVPDYRLPTTENSGRILRLNLESDGSFEKRNNDGLPKGYFVERYLTPQIHLTDPESEIVRSNDELQQLKLNRPTNPAFCRHGILHVSSFISQSHTYERRIYKMMCSGYPWTTTTTTNTRNDEDNSIVNDSVFLGWLQDDLGTSQQEKTPGPWGIAFSKNSDECYVTCAKVQESNSQDPSSNIDKSCLLKLPTCGCHQGMFDALITDEQLSQHQRIARYGRPRKFSTRRATSLVRSGIFDQPNYVTPI